MVPWESIKLSKESLFSRENEERGINVEGDHDSPKSIKEGEEDDLDFTITDDEKTPFKLSPEVKKVTKKPVTHN